MAVSETILEKIRGIVGPAGWIEPGPDMAPFLNEERALWRGDAPLVVRPASTGEIAQVIALCAEAGVGVVPQGGNTGLVGGGVARGEIILSLGRMNRVRAVDGANHTLTAEAGCVLADLQATADKQDFLFPLSLAAEGTCQIGGNISTNAGGVQVLRYGTTRDLVLGLEVVLPDGRIWDGLRGLRKDNTGYDLKQLFIGAEGTLGVVTAAVLKLFPKPRDRVTAIVATSSLRNALSVFQRIRGACGDSLSACELIDRTSLEFVLRHIPGTRDPCSAPHPFYVLIELTDPRADAGLRQALEAVLGQALEAGIVDDAAIAASGAQTADFWRIRETIPEAQKSEGGSIKHDVALPISAVADFIEMAIERLAAAVPGIRPVVFGHLGDGNIHFNLSQPIGADSAAFTARRPEINRIVYDLTSVMKGSFSAEHGIGLLKRDELSRYKSVVEIDLMRTVKRAIDPKNIVNPGKIV